MKNKVLSILLCLCMMVIFLPVSAFAEKPQEPASEETIEEVLEPTSVKLTETTTVSEALLAVHNLVSALPSVDDITDENRKGVQTQVGEISAAYDALTGDEQAAFDESEAAVMLYAVVGTLLEETVSTHAAVDSVMLNGTTLTNGKYLASEDENNINTLMSIDSDLTVTTTVENGYTYTDGALTFTKAGEYSIAMKGDLTGTEDRIVVNTPQATDAVTLTLNGVSITAPNGDTGADAFTVTSGDVTLNIAADSTLTGGFGTSYDGNGGNGIAGNVAISGTSKLTASGQQTYYGETAGSGISGNVAVSGSVQLEALGGNGGSGQAGGNGIKGNVEVSGAATVTATGKYGYGGQSPAIKGTITAAGHIIKGGTDENNINNKINSGAMSNYEYVSMTPLPDLTVTSEITDGYTYTGGVLTFTKTGNYTVAMKEGVTSTDDVISITASGVTLTLNGVNIEAPTGSAALTAANGVTLNVIADSSLTGGGATTDRAGAGILGNLTLTGSAALTVTGGSFTGVGLAGMGIIGSVSVSGKATLFAGCGSGDFAMAISGGLGLGGRLTVGEGFTVRLGTGAADAANKPPFPNNDLANSYLTDKYVIVTPLSTPPHTHCVCGGDIACGDHTAHTEDITYTPWSGGEITYTNQVASIYLTEDVTLTSKITVTDGKTLNLCLNGYKLKGNGTGCVINVINNSTLNLSDCQNSENAIITGGNGGIFVNWGSFNLYGGHITDNISDSSGGGICLNAHDGHFTMYGGSITGNTAPIGGGLYALGDDSVTLYGGSITGNTADAGGVGGGILCACNLTISGNMNISGNTVSEAASNVALVYGELIDMATPPTINIHGALTNETPIGVGIVEVTVDGVTYDYVFTPKAGVFTSGTAVTNSDYAGKFTSDSGSYTVTVADDDQLKLVQTHAITKAGATNGSFTVKVGGSEVTGAAENATVTITPTADANYELDTVTVIKTNDPNTKVTVGSSNTFTMPDYPVTVTVSFKLVSCEVTLPTTQTGYTLAAKSGSSSPVEHGGSYTFTFSLDNAYSDSTPVVKVNGTAVTLNNDGEYTINNITVAQTVTVESVIKNIYQVTLTDSDTGITGFQYRIGTTTDWTDYNAAFTVNHGDKLEIKAILDTGYTFTQWATGMTANPYTINSVNEAVSCTPTSTLNSYAVTLTDNDTGITGFQYRIGTAIDWTDYNAAFTVNHGDKLEIKAVLDTGYTFNQWATGITANPYTVNSVTEAVSCTPTSTLNSYQVTLTDSDTGITGFQYIIGTATDWTDYNAAFNVSHGDKLEIKAVLDTGYTFTHWATGMTANPYTINSVTEAVSCTPTSTLNSYAVTLTDSDTGITGFQYRIGTAIDWTDYNAAFTVSHGDKLEIKAILDTGYTFNQWATGMTANPYTVNSVTEAVSCTPTSTLNSYTITYDPGTNGSGEIPSGSKTQGTDFTLSSDTFTRASYTQIGWAGTDNATAVQYALGGSYTTDAAITLYPVWRYNPPYIPSTNPPANTVPVIIDGISYNIGTTNTTGDVTTITVNQGQLQRQIDNADEGVIIPVSSGADTVTAQLVVKNVEDMAKKGMTLSVVTGGISYDIPADTIDTDALMIELGASDPAKMPINITIAQLGDSDVTLKNGTLMLPPVEFTVTVSYSGKTVEVKIFRSYVRRVIELPSDIDPLMITTAVIAEHGAERHVPTEVFQQGGKWYARVNSLTNSVYALIYNEAEFTDAGGKWYEAVVTEMASREVINGRGNGIFDGDANITRAEFAAILVRALGLPAEGNGSIFTDVHTSEWYCGAVGTAYEYGLIKGKDVNHFDPEANITRQEAMLMIYRAAGITELAGSIGSLDSFSDAASVSAWALDAAKWNVGSGLIKGDSAGTIRGSEYISRGETAAIVLRLLQYSGLVDKRTEA